MPRSKKPVVDKNREAEILDSTVRMDGVGEDPIVQDLLSDKFVKGTDTEVAPIAMALAELITGMKMQSEQINAVMKRFDKIESAQRAWEKDKKKFLEDVDRRSASLITNNPIQKEKMMAEWAQAAQEAKAQAVAEMTVGRLQFDQMIEREPKEMVVSPGLVEMHRVGDTVSPVVVSEIIKLKHRVWELKPGIPTMLPKTVANHYRERLRSREILQKRQDVMKDGVRNQAEVSKGWSDIDKQYGVTSESLPLAG